MRGFAVSCVVRVFNNERYVREALESVLAQTRPPEEIVVVDDGSTDGTPAILASYGDRFRVVSQPNAGAVTARNVGLRATRGDLLAYIDGDDLWHPEKLAHQVTRFQARADLDLCLGHTQNFWIPELRHEAERFRNHRRAQPLPAFFVGAALVRRRLFEAVGEFNTGYGFAYDTEWFLRVLDSGATVEFVPEVLAYRRLHDANFSRSHASLGRAEYLDLVKATLDRRRTGAPGRPMTGAPP
jgi:glycosyltransferase involved in cell wall biosynthesis